MKYEFHPVANIFPLLDGEEFSQLVADIKDNGQREDIWLHPDGRIVDGRNRYRACIEAGVQPKFRTWNGQGSLVLFVTSLNLRRRHLTPSQAAAIAAEIMPMLEEEAAERKRAGLKRGSSRPVPEKFPERGESRELAAKQLNTNPRYVSEAKKIKETAPEMFQDIKTGAKTIPEVKRQLKDRNSITDIATGKKPEEEITDAVIVQQPKTQNASTNMFGKGASGESPKTVGPIEGVDANKIIAKICALIDEQLRLADDQTRIKIARELHRYTTRLLAQVTTSTFPSKENSSV